MDNCARCNNCEATYYYRGKPVCGNCITAEEWDNIIPVTGWENITMTDRLCLDDPLNGW